MRFVKRTQFRPAILAMATASLLLTTGCWSADPAPARVTSPAVGQESYRPESEPPKPLPPQLVVPDGDRPFNDPPLLTDTPPEAKAFVDTYKRVGRPRIVVFVNRTLEGQIVPTTNPDVDRIEQRTRTRTGPGQVVETRRTLKRDEYDELGARAIDYELMENLLADWMAADGQVTIISPTMSRRKLTDAEKQDLQAGRAQALSDLARQLDADILIQVQARPTRQTPEGLELRVVTEAMNVKGGESLARAAVDIYPPLDKVQFNKFTRFVSRKLMDGMTQTWSTPRAAQGDRPAAADDGRPRTDTNQGGPGPRLQ